MVEIQAEVVSHSRYFKRRKAEFVVQSDKFAEILRRTDLHTPDDKLPNGKITI